MRDRLVAIKKVIIFEDAKKKAFLQEAQIMKDCHRHRCVSVFDFLHLFPAVEDARPQISAGFGPSQYLQALGDLRTGPCLGDMEFGMAGVPT